jgi:hypothetical protein
MKHKLLISNRFKVIGLLLSLPSLALGIAVRFFHFSFEFLIFPVSPKGLFENSQQDWTDELALSGLIVGLLFIAFAREKQEDEFISRIRMESLQWAVLINYILLVLATWLIYDVAFIDVMMYNMLTVLIIFILRFHIVLWRYNYSAIHQPT